MEKIYTAEDLMMEVASVTPREYDGGFIDNSEIECSSDWEVPTGTLDQVKAWFKEHGNCDIEDGRITYCTLYEINENGYVDEPIIEARPVFIVTDTNTDKVYGHYNRFDEAQETVDKLWNNSDIDAVVTAETKFVEC